jgi:hypothetical protein
MRLGTSGGAIWPTAVVVLATISWCQTATAQPVHGLAGLDLTGGIEGGGSAYAEGVRRARTGLRLAFEAHLDGYDDSLLAAALLAEVEPAPSVGAELRFTQIFVDELAVHAHGAALLAPETLFGAGLGIGYRGRLSEILALEVGPLARTYFAGSDLPADVEVVWQVLLSAGVRLAMF